MLYGFTKGSMGNLYNPIFYAFSCAANIAVFSFGYMLIPTVGPAVCGVGIAVVCGLMLELALRKNFNDDQYRIRYVTKILCGIVVVASGSLYIDQDYVLYVPILVGMAYITVNTILRSSILQACSITLLLVAPLKILLVMESSKFVAYMSTIVMETALVILTFAIFRTNKERLEETEKTVAILRGHHSMNTHQFSHDMRNVLQSMQELATSKYRTDPIKWLEKFDEYVASIDELCENYKSDEMSQVSIDSIIDALSHMTTNRRIIFNYVKYDDDPVLSYKNYVFWVLRNLIENSIEAANRRGILGTVAVVKSKNTITITDNCGGFDVSGIAHGNTSKTHDPKKHGVFLRTITDPSMSYMYGFTTVVENIKTGTQATLVFHTKQPK